jgi:hypothetical protein
VGFITVGYFWLPPGGWGGGGGRTELSHLDGNRQVTADKISFPGLTN